MKLLVFGASGQVGTAVLFHARTWAEPAPRARADITDAAAVRAWLAQRAPDAVVNCAAYTAVDAAESHHELAYAVNADGAGHVARACAERGIPLVHVSTDYVFDGTSRVPYREDDPLAPLGVYGASKAAGEQQVHAAGGIVVRTSWVFSDCKPSFVRTIIRAAIDRPALRVVDDQIGCPTFADDLGAALVALAERALRGDDLDATYHACNAEPVTWCGFARAIVDEARKHRELACTDVAAITTADYPTAAKRPAYSVLDTSRLRRIGIALPSWRAGLAVAAEAIARVKEWT